MARAWLEQSVTASDAGAAFTLMPMGLASFLRRVTSPKIFRRGTPVDDAEAHTGEHLVSFDRDFKKLLGRSQFTLLMPA